MINIILFNLHVLIRVINRRILKNKYSHGRETNKKLTEKVNSYKSTQSIENLCYKVWQLFSIMVFFFLTFFVAFFMDMHVVHALTLAGHAPFHLLFVSIFLSTFFSYNYSFHTTFKGNTIFESWIWSFDWSWWLYKTKYMYKAIFNIAPENEVHVHHFEGYITILIQLLICFYVSISLR